MVKTYYKVVRRMFKKQFTRLLSLIGIILISVGFVSGIGSPTDMIKDSIENYYKKQNVSDFIIKSKTGRFTQEEIDKIKNHFGQENVETGMSFDIKTGEKKFEPGILAKANRNILYVDEVNLLDDHVVDVLLDSAAMGVNTVEREGVSYTHPARFVLVGTMNPEEGELRPQLIDRFGLSVTVSGEHDTERRMKVLENRLKYENDPEGFFKEYEPRQRDLRERILRARSILRECRYSREILRCIANICIELEVDGHRADITMLKTAMTAAACDGRREATRADVMEAAKFALPHRMRRRPFEEISFDISRIEGI